ncbi:LPXTG cell wall anchor domain-containing protein [Streptomyces polyrhachis]|uniref:LPXTG cell wall anchor domain-containing protein n=1 Tax=Streptomyces polyrhachis TaxID=1282885 RepID=A0ABW2GMW2_9ACTN
MRTLASTCAVTAAAAASLLFAAPAALADAPGDNGTVKIHDATTGEELMKNEPHVCTFYLDAFKFDSTQKAEWRIVAWKPTGDNKTEVASGAITLDDEGHGRTEDLNLADGHYKLFWNFEGENGAAKHKVFWTDCEDSTESPEPSGSATPSDSPKPGESVEPTASGSNAPAPNGGDGGSDLAETGATVGITSAAGLALVGAGAYLVMRRRSAAGQH